MLAAAEAGTAIQATGAGAGDFNLAAPALGAGEVAFTLGEKFQLIRVDFSNFLSWDGRTAGMLILEGVIILRER